MDQFVSDALELSVAAYENAAAQVITFTHEPFAAVFGWFYSQRAEFRNLPNQKILVFDWGGGTLDITLVQVQDGRIFELGNAALSDCAGDEFTERLTGLARDKFLARISLNVNQMVLEAETKDRVWGNVEDAKIKLSTDKITVLNVPNYTSSNGVVHDLNEPIMRDEYEQRILSAVEAAKAKVYECLHRAGVEAPLVNLVLLIGGTSRTPLVQRMMHEAFVTKVVPVPDADAVIAKGAALISAHNWKPYLAKPITVKLADDSYLPIFEYGQPLAAPVAQKRFTFYCTDWRNGTAQFLFYEQQKARDTASQKTLNCNLIVPTSPNVQQISELDRIIVSCSITEDLTIRIEAQSSSLGLQHSATVLPLP